ncbi:MAG: hypothetical protein QGH76_09250 [Phycisphaerales bacterium]|jgi:hypothetical protein|nr:hypothetical protein [Phycisphaerales bacterium]
MGTVLTAITLVLSAQCPAPADIPATTPGGVSGTSVAMDGDLAVIGAPIGTGNAWASGMAIVYRRAGDTWIREAELIAEDGNSGDMLGVCVDISGDRVIAGSWFEDHAGSDSGAAYVFERQGGTWSQTAKLIAEDGGAGDTFGRRVAIAGDVCVVTAPLDDDNGTSSGSAYVFQFDSGRWFQLQKLVPNSGGAGDQFGLGLAMDGERIVLGAPWADDARGRGHIFDRGDVMFFEVATLSDPSGEPSDYLGFGAAVNGGMVALGSYRDDDGGEDAGSVFLFQEGFGGWGPVQRIDPSSKVAVGDQFGVCVSMEEGVMIVGTRYADVDGMAAGAAVVYDLIDGMWIERAVLVSPGPAEEAEFGWSVALSGDHAIIGGPWAEPDGEVRFYDGMTQPCTCPGDLNGDGAVAVGDLLQVIAAWGPCVSCIEDIDQSGAVDVSDLLAVIAAWGDC